MKKWILWFLILLLVPCFALSEYTGPEYAMDRLVVGNTTVLSGRFTTRMWGSNTSDMDVFALVNGCNLIRWDYELGNFKTDPSVVTGLTAEVNAGEEGADPLSPEGAAGSCTYVFRLSRDMKYSDGTPITAADYAFSILLNSCPQAGALGGKTDAFDALLGAEEYRTGARTEMTGVRIEDPYTLHLTVRKEYRPFFYELGLLRCNPLPIAVIAPGCEVRDDGKGAYISGPFTAELLEKTLLDPETGYVSHPSVVSGPYRLVSYDAGTHTAEFEINEAYQGNFQGTKPTIRYLTLKPAENATMIEGLASGEFGLLDKVLDANAIRQGLELLGSGNYAMTAYPRTGLSFLSFNCEKAIAGRPAVRKAVACCLDKDQTVALYTGDYGLRVDGYYGIGQWMYQVLTGAAPRPVEEPGENASDAEVAAYENEMAKWDQLSLDSLTVYPLDPAQAARLLEEDGWTLNRKGEAFVPGTDDVRCRMENGQLQALELSMIYPEGNRIGEILEQTFLPYLKEAGIGLTMQPVEWNQLLRQYYRQDPRECDMIYLASNFSEVFNPWPVFNPEDAEEGVANYTGVRDEELARAAMDLSRTEPGDNYGYMVNWITFQEKFTEVLPLVPIYSNVYYDFYPVLLQGFTVQQNMTWSEAIVGSSLAYPAPDENPEP